MNFSYWEHKSWFTAVDYTIVGSGIVGLSCAIRLRQRFPNANILVIERGILPQGASTKNAGFACFGSVSEILDDLKTHSETEVLALIKQRISGLQALRETLGDTAIDYKPYGGYEFFSKRDAETYNNCQEKLPYINELLQPIFNKEVYTLVPNAFGFASVYKQLIFNAFEGQIDTGKMMHALLKKVYASGVKVINNCELQSYVQNGTRVHLTVNDFEFVTKKLCIATNGFARQLDIPEIRPARAQVLITKPIQELKIKGTFHFDKGYYYFRNIDNRILLGGGRNLDFKGEETTVMKETALIQNELERLLREVILPDTSFEIDHRWSGIMGVGNQKKPILQKLEEGVYCGVRLGGMGVAIGSVIGRNLADLIEE